MIGKPQFYFIVFLIYDLIQDYQTPFVVIDSFQLSQADSYDLLNTKNQTGTAHTHPIAASHAGRGIFNIIKAYPLRAVPSAGLMIKVHAKNQITFYNCIINI
jgi:hypothetical protein